MLSPKKFHDKLTELMEAQGIEEFVLFGAQEEDAELVTFMFSRVETDTKMEMVFKHICLSYDIDTSDMDGDADEDHECEHCAE